jgi:hypothetical protein
MATINMVNRVRYRVAHAEKDCREALELLRQATAEADYCGPPLEPVEGVAASIAEIKVQIRDWAIDEALRRPPKRRPVVSRATVQGLIKEATLRR